MDFHFPRERKRTPCTLAKWLALEQADRKVTDWNPIARVGNCVPGCVVAVENCMVLVESCVVSVENCVLRGGCGELRGGCGELRGGCGELRGECG